jgi:hypothetical protein
MSDSSFEKCTYIATTLAVWLYLFSLSLIFFVYWCGLYILKKTCTSYATSLLECGCTWFFMMYHHSNFYTLSEVLACTYIATTLEVRLYFRTEYRVLIPDDT